MPARYNVTPLATIPEAKTTAVESTSLEACVRSSLTQQFISQPKKLIGSWGMLSNEGGSGGILTV